MSYEAIFTRHAQSRCQQRGIGRDSVELMITEADREVHVGNGCRALSISHARIQELRAEGVATTLLECLSQAVVVVSEGERTIITVLRSRGKCSRRYFRSTDNRRLRMTRKHTFCNHK